MKKILIVADPLESFKIYKDTTFAMMRELQKRGHTLATCEPEQMQWQSGHPGHRAVRAMSRSRAMRTPGSRPPPRCAIRCTALTPCSCARTRPFDSEFFYATHLAGAGRARRRARVQQPARTARPPRKNSRSWSSPQFAPPTLVTRLPAAIRAFHAEHKDIILKPLDGMGGMGIFRVGADGMNLGSIIETLNQGGSTSVMVQRYLPQIVDGDKRLLVIGGVAAPFCLARIPQGSEIRGNLAAGGKGVAMPLSDSDWAIAKAIGPTLAERGLLLVGLDVIGDKVTEINVTSPTCFQEIQQQTGFDVPAMFVDALEKALA